MRLKSAQAYRKTLPIHGARLLAGTAVLLVSLIFLLLFFFIGALVGEDMLLFLFFVWLVLSLLLFHFYKRHISYLFQIGTDALLARCIALNVLPPNQISRGLEQAQERFANVGEYHALLAELKRTLRELTAERVRAGHILSPKSGAMTRWFQTRLLYSYLRYVLNGCMGYVMLHTEVDPSTAAAESAAVFCAHSLRLLRDALRIALATLLLCAISFIVLTLLLFPLFRLLSAAYAIWIALFFGYCLTVILNECLWGSYISAVVMRRLLALSQKIDLSYALFSHMSELSPAGRKLVARIRP